MQKYNSHLKINVLCTFLFKSYDTTACDKLSTRIFLEVLICSNTKELKTALFKPTE